MVREIKELPTDLGREVKAVYDAGELVDDDLMIRLIGSRLDRGDTLPGFILDGFPRNMAQAEALDQLLRELDRDIDVVFEFQVPKTNTLLDRMLKRAAEEDRSDDTPEAIRRRLEIYHEQTAPLVEYYRSTRGNVVGIHADRTVDKVFSEIRDALATVEARA
jgi:adenylate kinase